MVLMCFFPTPRQDRSPCLRAPITSRSSKQLALPEGYTQLLGGGGGGQGSLSRGPKGECVPGGASGSPDGHGSRWPGSRQRQRLLWGWRLHLSVLREHLF